MDHKVTDHVSTIKVPVKLLSDKAKFPTKTHITDAGFDLYTNKTTRIGSGAVGSVPTGIAMNIPPGYFGKIEERSGVSEQRGLIVKAGVIDAGYTGEIKCLIYNHGDMPEVLDEGTKLTQIVIHVLPLVEMVQVDTLEATDRADKGFGHSDKL